MPEHHARLTLTIDETDYLIYPVFSNAGTALELRKQSEQRERYLVQRTSQGACCTCPDFTRRRRICKHIRALRIWWEM